jgi:hypothetical protein
MTHDELLAKIDEQTDFDAGYALGPALRAVVELHKPIEQTTGISYTQENGLEVLATEFICEFCRNTGVIEHRYPCPTIKTIEKELN